MVLTSKIKGIVMNNALEKAYNDLWKKCPLEKRELLNLIMIEASCGLPFVDRLVKYIPEIIENKPK